MIPDTYSCFNDLAAHEREGHDYIITAVNRQSPIVIIAPHGGGIEPGTSEIAAALAGDRYSLYSFDGLKDEENESLHLTSIHFDEPRCLELVRDSRAIISIHGCSGDAPLVYLGGSAPRLKDLAAAALQQAGFRVDYHPNFGGDHADNICNRSRTGCSLQLETSNGLRVQMFCGMRRVQRRLTTPVFHKFIVALQGILRTIEIELQ